ARNAPTLCSEGDSKGERAADPCARLGNGRRHRQHHVVVVAATGVIDREYVAAGEDCTSLREHSRDWVGAIIAYNDICVPDLYWHAECYDKITAGKGDQP